MGQQKRQTFLHGAFILVVGSIMVKLIGAGFKIPLANLIDKEGMGYFSTAYTLYAFFVLTAKGLSVAVSKMVSESASLGRSRESDRIFYVASAILGMVGISGTAVLYFGAAGFSGAFGNPMAELCIKSISPAVLFVALLSAFRGYFQGKQNMYPTAISEVIEALGKLVVGILLALLYIKVSIVYAAAGAVLGVSIGTFAAFLLVAAFFIVHKRRSLSAVGGHIRSIRSIARELVVIAFPITIGASISSLTGVVDMVTIINRLKLIVHVSPQFIQKFGAMIDSAKFTGGIYEELANALYGLYTGYAITLFNLPLTLIVALSISVLPAISAALARRDERSAQKLIQSVLRITMMFALPCAAGLYALSAPILKMLYNDALADTLLQITAFSVVFVSFVQVTSAVLQAYGKMHIPLINMLIGCAVKIVLNFLLIGMPSVHINGAPIGTAACYLIISVLNLICIIRITGFKPSVSELLIKPLIASAGMAAVSVLVLHAVGGVGFLSGRFAVLGRIAVLPAIAAGGAVYVLLILLVGAVKESDLAMLPMGAKAAKILGRLHLLR